MTQFTVVPMYRKGTVRYNAPVFYMEASSNANAKENARKNSSLGRFPEWDFHVIETSKDNTNLRRNKKLVSKPKKDPNSKSQLGKSLAGHGHFNSRPVRRGLRRLSQSMGSVSDGQKKPGSIKMW